MQSLDPDRLQHLDPELDPEHVAIQSTNASNAKAPHLRGFRG